MNKRNVRGVKRACYLGYLVQAIINNLLPLFFVLLQQNYNLSYAMLGSLIFINFISQLIVDAVSIGFVQKIGTKNAVLIAHLLSAVGTGLMAILPYVINVYAGLVICIIIYAVGSGLIEVLISPIVDKASEDNKAGSMSLLHSFYCWGQALTVLLTTAFIILFGENWRFVPLLWVIVPLVNFFYFLKLDVPEVSNEKGEKSGVSVKNVTYILLILMMFCAGASELAMSQWSSSFAENGLGVSKALGDLLGPCMFAVLMGIGRVIYGVFAFRMNILKAISFSGALGVICYLSAAFCGSKYIALIACAVCGLSVSMLWPAVFSMGSVIFKSGGALLFGTLAMAGDLGCAIGPMAAGAAAQLGGFTLSFAACAVFPLILIICSYFLERKTGGLKL